MSLQAYLFNADGTDQEIEFTEKAVKQLNDRQLLWVDIVGREEDDVDCIADILKFNKRSVNNLLNPVQRPRLTMYSDYFHVYVIAVKQDTKPEYDHVPLDLFCGKNYVVTVHPKEVEFLEDFRSQLKGDTELGKLTAESLVATLLEWHINSYFRALENLEAEVDKLDEEILSSSPERSFIPELVKLRSRVSRLRRLLSPHRDVFYALSRPDFTLLADNESAPHFRTLNDRFERAVDSIETARDLVISSFDLLTTRTAEYTNDVMKVLTFATVMLGATGVIASILGMNFELAFFKSGAAGFWTVIVSMAFLISGSVIVAKRKGWL
ncbi:MAG: magnesium transporter CorA family protein [Acidobacteria bacterium]|nr:magnesium transporter CorA family protein [Acidobacteriota bacterium]